MYYSDVRNFLKESRHTHLFQFITRYFLILEGFSKSITMPKSQYDKYIKHYTGSELMECRVYEGVNYFKITENIQRQVHYVVDHIEKIRKKERKTPKKFPGLDKWKVTAENNK